MTGGTLRPRSVRALARRVALFLSLLMSGGLLLFPRVPMLALILLLCLAIVGNIQRIRRELLPVIALLTVILLLTLLRPGGFDLASTLTRYANFAAALALLGMYLRTEPGALPKDLWAMLPWLAVQAVLTPLIATVASPLFTTVNINGTNYETLLFIFTYHVFLEDSAALARPDGFFFEPGVFQIYLNIYLFLALFVFRQWRHVALAIAAVLATQSTTGLVVMLLILSYGVLSELRTASLRRKLSVAGVAMLLVAPLLTVTIANIESKTLGENRGSAWAREYDFLTGLGVISSNPWIGIGFDYSDYYQMAQQHGFTETALSEEHIRERGNSNGLITLFYTLGIPLGLLFVVGLFRQRFFPHRALFGVCMMLCLFGEALSFAPFFLLLMFSGLIIPSRRPSGLLALNGGVARGATS
jgi:hypothetical protein